MTRIIFFFIFFSFSLTNSFGQKERKLVREGVKEYQGDQFSEAEVNFRKALDSKPGLYEADYNIANSLYKQKKYEESAAEYEKLIQNNTDPEKRADLYHNLGNSHIMAQQFEKGVDAYKNSLRIRPDDEDTRFNLAYALQMMKEQQNQQDKQQQDKDKQKQEQEKDQQGQNQQEQEKEQQEQQEQEKKEQEKQQQEQQVPQEISEQEAEQILNAIENQEKDVKEKVDKKKAVARPVASEKDW